MRTEKDTHHPILINKKLPIKYCKILEVMDTMYYNDTKMTQDTPTSEWNQPIEVIPNPDIQELKFKEEYI